MAESSPSWKTSTLSQLAAFAVIVFAGAAVMTGIGVIWFKLPLEQAKEVISPFSVLLSMFGASYLTARKTNGEVQGGTDAKPGG